MLFRSVDDFALVRSLIYFLRTGEGSSPFGAVPAGSAFDDARHHLLLLDDLHAAPSDFFAALEAYRCRAVSGVPCAWGNWDVIAATRVCPEGATGVFLGPLSLEQTEMLLDELGEPRARAGALHASSAGNAGFVVAAVGRVPLTRDAAAFRIRSLSKSAQIGRAHV